MTNGRTTCLTINRVGTRVTSTVALLIAAGLGSAQPTAPSDASARLVTDAPAAWDGYRSQLRGWKWHFTRVTKDNATNVPLYGCESHSSSLGESFIDDMEQTIPEADYQRYCRVRNANNAFVLKRANKSATWALTEYVKRQDGDPAGRFKPATSELSFLSIEQRPLRSLLSDPAVRLTSIQMPAGAADTLCRVDFTCTKQQRPGRDDVLFDRGYFVLDTARSWLPTEFDVAATSVEFGPVRFRGTNTIHATVGPHPTKLTQLVVRMRGDDATHPGYTTTTTG